ncbi:MAG: thioredoxin [Chloroflexi bacterium]|nr:thioredoxin [Chloroflexota bacterium]MCH9038529.1 thioredoxin [Chloroflexota bacterium]MCI0770406.1 thioredoxin [Chloroflexota bacterium]MCI0790205.1 thioredoxin [Chloroflexota bacterium]MCI0795211.1 thioredoxin [Chloroflexota bacterium]
MAKPITVTDANFDEEVLQSETPVLVDFWAEWCGPCKAIGPVIDELAEEYDGKVKFAKLDVDSNPKTPINYGIRGIPAMLIFNGGSVAKQVVGAVPKASLKKSIDEAIAG